MKLLILSLCFISTQLFAQEVQSTSAPLPGSVPAEESPFEKAVKGATPVSNTGETAETSSSGPAAPAESSDGKLKSADLRDRTFGAVLLGFEPFTTWIPLKKTVSYTHNFNRRWSLEGEYAWSTLDVPFVADLGEITERRFSLMAHYYPGNSFHFDFGPYFNKFKAQVGSDILNNISGASTTSSFGTDTLGIMGGFGNRWQWENGITVNLDWFRLYVPMITTDTDSEILGNTTNVGDEESIKKVIHRFNRIPTFVLFGISVGYSF